MGFAVTSDANGMWDGPYGDGSYVYYKYATGPDGKPDPAHFTEHYTVAQRGSVTPTNGADKGAAAASTGGSWNGGPSVRDTVRQIPILGDAIAGPAKGEDISKTGEAADLNDAAAKLGQQTAARPTIDATPTSATAGAAGQAAVDKAAADLATAKALSAALNKNTPPGAPPALPPPGTPTVAEAQAAFNRALAAQQSAANPIYTSKPATYDAPQIDHSADVTAGKIGAPDTITPTSVSAGSVTAPTISLPGSITPGSVSSQTVTADHIDRILADPTLTAQSRDTMLKALGMAEGAANGTAPSAAVQLLQKAIDTNARQALGAATTLQGRSPGAALRVGQQGMLQADANSAADMAALRAQEQATGRAQYGQFATNLYNTDVTSAGQQLSADVATSVANLNAKLSAATASAQLALNAGEFNAAQAYQAQADNIKNQLQVATTNASASLTSQISNMTAALDAAKANQATALAAGEHNAANALSAKIAQLTADLDAAKANKTSVDDINSKNASLKQNAGQFNANAENDANKFNAGQATTQEQIDDNRAGALRDDQIDLLKARLGLKSQSIQNTNTFNQAQAAGDRSLLIAGGQIAAGGGAPTNSPLMTPTTTPSWTDTTTKRTAQGGY